MPIYDHLCDHCGHAFSVVQSFKDPPVEACPRCGKRPRRLISPPAIVFKGSGWYKTDSRSSAAKDGAKTETASDAAKPSETAKGSESAKPDTTGTKAAT